MSLKFEYEMKGKFIQNCHLLLVSNRLQEFEQKLSLYFFLYFGKLLPLNYSYLDWLVIQLRPIRKQPSLPSGLNSDYIQFLNYAQNLDFEIKYIDQIPYRVLVFRLQDFLQVQNKSKNQYQLEKIKLIPIFKV